MSSGCGGEGVYRGFQAPHGFAGKDIGVRTETDGEDEQGDTYDTEL